MPSPGIMQMGYVVKGTLVAIYIKEKLDQAWARP